MNKNQTFREWRGWDDEAACCCGAAVGCRRTEWQSNFFKACWVDGAMRVRGADLEKQTGCSCATPRCAKGLWDLLSLSVSLTSLFLFSLYQLFWSALFCADVSHQLFAFPLRIIHSMLSKLWNEDWLEISLAKLTFYCLVFVLLFNQWANILKIKR